VSCATHLSSQQPSLRSEGYDRLPSLVGPRRWAAIFLARSLGNVSNPIGFRGDVATVTLQRIHGVQVSLATAINRTSERSVLPDIEQSRVLGESCAEACALLADWLRSSWWDMMKPSRSGRRSPIAEFVPSRSHFEDFLGPMLKDAYLRAARQCGMTVSASDVDDALAAVQATARRYPHMSRRDLFEVANSRVDTLKQQVCEVSDRLGYQIRTRENRTKAHGRAVQVGGLLTSLVLAIAGYSPSAARANLSNWGKTAIEVITLYNIAEHALPEQPVAPPKKNP
jgi:hypothetical protein